MQPKNFTDPYIALLNVELELKAEKENAEVRVETVEVGWNFEHRHFYRFIGGWHLGLLIILLFWLFRNIRKSLMQNGRFYTTSYNLSMTVELRLSCRSCLLEMSLHNGSLIAICSALVEFHLKIWSEYRKHVGALYRHRRKSWAKILLVLVEILRSDKLEAKGTV